MVIIGLTGSIGTGKSTTGRMFADHGIQVYDADAQVHALYDGGTAAAPVEARFPGTAVDGKIDRKKLSAAVLSDPEDLRDLEKIVHPLVQKVERDFLAKAFARGDRFVVLEIPLLLETGGRERCDVIVATSVTPEIQRQRVLARSDMTTDKFEKILSKQMPMNEKNARSHFIVDTSLGLDAAVKQVDDILRAIRPLQGHIYEQRLQAAKNT